MDVSKFNLYSISTENERRTTDEYNKVLQQIEAMEKCRTIAQIKTFLKDNWNLTESTENFKLGSVGTLSVQDTDENLKVTVSFADEVHTSVFPKLQVNTAEQA